MEGSEGDLYVWKDLDETSTIEKISRRPLSMKRSRRDLYLWKISMRSQSMERSRGGLFKVTVFLVDNSYHSTQRSQLLKQNIFEKRD